MIAALRGDARAYRALLLELTPWLRSYYAKRLPMAMVDDAAQEVLMTLHAKRHTYDPAKPFGPWLVAIARYKWIDRLRAMKETLSDEIPEEIAAPDTGESFGSAQTLDALMSRLKPAQAEAIRLVKIEGLTVKEAAERLGQTIALVKVNIHRGLRQMSELAQAEPHEL
ncbi:MAG: sigma-70 family RNA polymerase sigma factor [Gammaproteobacteria bacterium]|nr:sigma-70 family RNA polymerase sigma factor [Gammaproteobacteria bacterium]